MRSDRNRQGFTLVELAVVLGLIGIMATVAAVSMRSGDAAVRSQVREVRFGLEKAKQEAIARGRNVYVEFFEGPFAPCGTGSGVGFPCAGHGVTCGVLYSDKAYGEEHANGYSSDHHDVLECLEIPSRLISVTGTDILRFSPFGGSLAGHLEMRVGDRGYRVSVNHIGGVVIDRIEEN